MRPFLLPYRNRLDADAGFQQHVIGKIGHIQFRRHEIAGLTVQENGDVRIAVRPVGFSCPAAEENGTREIVPLRD